MQHALLFAISLLALFTAASAQERDYTPVDKQISAEGVLRLVNTAYPGLEQFAAAMHAGDLARAQATLIEHFATRQKPTVPPVKFPHAGTGNSMLVLRGSAADKATADSKWLKHIFTQMNNDIGKPETFQLGTEIRWMDSPSKSLNFTGYLNQLNIISRLAGVYKDTKEDKYATEAGNMLISWTRQVYPGYGYTRDGELVDSGMEVRNRLCNCITAYDVLRAAPSMTPQMHIAFWKLFITCCRELIVYSGVSYPGLITAAVMFPEFTEAGDWLQAGKEDITKHLVGRTTPEGAWDTHSIAYQTVPVPWAVRCLEFLEANPDSGQFADIQEMIRTQCGKLVELMLRIAMPDLGLPNIGDTYGRSDWGPNHITKYLDWYPVLRLDDRQREQLAAIEEPYDRLKTTLALIDGSRRHEPGRASVPFPGTGYYVMRSGWQHKSPRYLYFDLSAQAIGHAHNDAGHFELYAYGKPLLTDTGDYFLGWGYRTALHNTIEVDEQQQARGAAAQMLPYEWLASDLCDLADGAHTAYEHIGVRHRRKMLFVKPDYFILCDLLTGEGDHKCEQFFHFAGPTQTASPDTHLDPQTLVAHTGHPGVSNIRIIPAYTDGLQADFYGPRDTDMNIKDKFQRHAMLGWMVSQGTFQRVKSPALTYTRESSLPQAFHDVLFPTPAYARDDLSTTTLPVTQGTRTLPPTKAACMSVAVSLDRLVRDPAAIRPELGQNLALGKTAFAQISATAFSRGPERLTDGDTGPRRIEASMSSSPYSPGVPLQGRFGVQFDTPTEINTVVLHHGTWNGQTILYAPERLSVQVWHDDDEWRDIPNQVTHWRDDQVSVTEFDTLRCTRISVHVERASGGRLCMREIEAFRVSAQERARAQHLKTERRREQWTDFLLISHEGPALRTYGSIEFDGELAMIRTTPSGAISRAFIKGGSTLRMDGRLLIQAEKAVDKLGLQWRHDTIVLDCLAPYGIRVAAQGASQVESRGTDAGATVDGETLVLPTAPNTDEPRISNARVQIHPPQQHLAGGQPWASVTWRTDRPATSQVRFGVGGVRDRRTNLQDTLVTDHSVRVEFLLRDAPYTFEVVSRDQWGNRARAVAK